MAANPPSGTLSDDNHPFIRGFHVLCPPRFVELRGYLIMMNARGVKPAQKIFFAVLDCTRAHIPSRICLSSRRLDANLFHSHSPDLPVGGESLKYFAYPVLKERDHSTLDGFGEHVGCPRL